MENEFLPANGRKTFFDIAKSSSAIMNYGTFCPFSSLGSGDGGGTFN